MTQITTGPDGQTLFDGMTVGELARAMENDALALSASGLLTPADTLDTAAAALRHLSEWQPIETAPRDGKPIWAIIRPDLDRMEGVSETFKRWAGRQIPLQHEGCTSSDFDIGWWRLAFATHRTHAGRPCFE